MDFTKSYLALVGRNYDRYNELAMEYVKMKEKEDKELLKLLM